MANIIVDKWRFIPETEELYLGYEFEKNGKRALQKRCDYCGKTMIFDIKNIESWGDNIKMGFNGWPEKIHCGNSLCQDYHRRVILHQKKEAKKWAERGKRLFFSLKKAGAIA